MKYLILMAALILTGCFPYVAETDTEAGGTVVCVAGGPMKFKGRIDTSGPWLRFTTDDGTLIRTSFPCAVIWNK